MEPNAPCTYVKVKSLPAKIAENASASLTHSEPQELFGDHDVDHWNVLSQTTHVPISQQVLQKSPSPPRMQRILLATMGRSTFTPKLSLPIGNHHLHLIHPPLDRDHSPSQSASGSNQPFCHNTLSIFFFFFLLFFLLLIGDYVSADFSNFTTVPSRSRTLYRTLIGSHTLLVKCNHWRAAAPLTGSAQNHFRHLLTSALDSSATRLLLAFLSYCVH